MIKRGDLVFGSVIAVLITEIILLLLPAPQEVIIGVGVGGFGFIVSFFLISWLVIPKRSGGEVLSQEVKTILKLIEEADKHLKHDVQKSVEAYKQIKHYYSKLHPKEKSIVLREVMSLYLRLLERIHLKK